MIEIIITPSKKSDKKFDAVIDGKKPCYLVPQSTLILHSIRTQPENKGTWIVTRLEKTGTILQRLGHWVKMYCGINKAYQQV